MKKILLSFFLLFTFFQVQATLANFCTMDAKQCDDWSYVWRTWPNCEFVCPSDVKVKACTKEYAPVCAQPPMPYCPEGMSCIQVMPQPKTYANKCMAELDNAKISHEGECKSTIISYDDIKDENIDDDLLICPMIYAPVCWKDWKTYSNSCFAWNVWVKYEGSCLSTNQEKRLESSWDRVFTKWFSHYKNSDKVFVLESLITKINLVVYNDEKEQWVYSYIKYLSTKSLKKIYEQVIYDNISKISPVDPVLWWSWYVLSVNWIDKNTATVEYEDGHIMESIKININIINRKINIKLK